MSGIAVTYQSQRRDSEEARNRKRYSKARRIRGPDHKILQDKWLPKPSVLLFLLSTQPDFIFQASLQLLIDATVELISSQQKKNTISRLFKSGSAFLYYP